MGSNKRSITTGIPYVLQLTSISLRERKNSEFGLASAYPQHFSSAAASGSSASANLGRYRRRSLNLDGGVVPDAHPRRSHSAKSEHLQRNHSSPSANIRPRHDGSKFPRRAEGPAPKRIPDVTCMLVPPRLEPHRHFESHRPIDNQQNSTTCCSNNRLHSRRGDAVTARTACSGSE
ncbi:MAG: hypothetical protein GY696_06535 [Gammaproteobacteria bacterium]|nr:hypothetical protein [Gammaproteobacteria bacterium]